MEITSYGGAAYRNGCLQDDSANGSAWLLSGYHIYKEVTLAPAIGKVFKDL